MLQKDVRAGTEAIKELRVEYYNKSNIELALLTTPISSRSNDKQHQDIGEEIIGSSNS
ncbi:hypothetical protein ES332_D03G089600v1 [Gossypium tomentosum]|uniref:Uncharacterized protein n=1 Tax=Gossypium tomentosum TaxID=34277 RepID=A0A5D2LMF6_GOSTO|nr:hypothetical protein ES332_D03G089600v1 [Gossypium tomentosum]